MKRFDVQVHGGGIVGRSLALSLAGLGLQVALRDAETATEGGKDDDVRAYALNAASLALLRRLKVWDALPPHAATAVHDMRIDGDAHGARLEFSGWEQCVGELAWIVDAVALDAQLAAAVGFSPHITRVAADDPAGIADADRAPLAALCEGRSSARRQALGVAFEREPYGHRAIAARLTASRVPAEPRDGPFDRSGRAGPTGRGERADQADRADHAVRSDRADRTDPADRAALADRAAPFDRVAPADCATPAARSAPADRPAPADRAVHADRAARAGLGERADPTGRAAPADAEPAPHHGVARQWFRSPDVLALLPLDTPRPGASYALVWSMPDARAEALLAAGDDDFAQALNAATGGAAGRLVLASPRQSWPLARASASAWCGPGWVLLGDAAHLIHPLAGQGLNLGLADVAALTRVVAAREPWRTLGDPKLLRRYVRERRVPTQAMSQLTDGLLRLFAEPAPAVRELRNRGLSLVNAATPLKRWLAAQALGQ